MIELSVPMLILSDVFSPCPNSASQRVTSFASALSQERFKVTVLAATRCRRKKLIPIDNNFLIYDLRYPKFMLSVSSVMMNPILVLLYIFMSIILVLRKNLKAILVSVPNGEVAIAGFFLSRLFGIPLIIDMRDLYPPNQQLVPLLPAPVPPILNQSFTRLFVFLYKRVCRITCVEYNTKTQLLNMRVPTDKIVVIPNGADASVYKPCNSIEERDRIRLKYGLQVKDLIFVYAGSLVRYYPVWATIKGLKHVPPKERKNVRLLIISYTGYSSYISFMRSLRSEKNVRFIGPLPIHETAQILSACDVGLVTYRREKVWGGMHGAKIFSYLSCGLPVLVSGPETSVIKDLVSKYRLGIYVGEPSEHNFAEGIMYFLKNKNRKVIMGQNGRKLVENSYDRKKIASKMVEVVSRITRT